MNDVKSEKYGRENRGHGGKFTLCFLPSCQQEPSEVCEVQPHMITFQPCDHSYTRSTDTRLVSQIHDWSVRYMTGQSVCKLEQQQIINRCLHTWSGQGSTLTDRLTLKMGEVSSKHALCAWSVQYILDAGSYRLPCPVHIIFKA